jgi:hypothetical protein
MWPTSPKQVKLSGGLQVKKMICVAALVAALFTMASAQDVKTMPPAAISEKVLQQAIPGQKPIMASDWHVKPAALKFCPKATCLYYAGDFDSNDSNANGLFNANDTGAGESAYFWQGVKPTAAATITGATFNEFFEEEGVGTNPTPFQAQTGITVGKAGKLICNTTGTATEAVYGEADFGLTQYSYTIKKLKKSCKVAAKKSTYINVEPTFSDNFGYVVNVEDAKPANHKGWKNSIDNNYWNSTTFGDTYIQAWDYDGLSFDLVSIALTGTSD